MQAQLDLVEVLRHEQHLGDDLVEVVRRRELVEVVAVVVVVVVVSRRERETQSRSQGVVTSVSDARAEFVLVTWSLMRRTAHPLTEDGQNVHNWATARSLNKTVPHGRGSPR